MNIRKVVLWGLLILVLIIAAVLAVMCARDPLESHPVGRAEMRVGFLGA